MGQVFSEVNVAPLCKEFLQNKHMQLFQTEAAEFNLTSQFLYYLI